MILNTFILTVVQRYKLIKYHLRSFRRSVRSEPGSRQVFWVMVIPSLQVCAYLALAAAEAETGSQKWPLKTSLYLIISEVFVCNTAELSDSLNPYLAS